MFSEEGLQQQCHSQTDKLQLVQSQVPHKLESRFCAVRETTVSTDTGAGVTV